MTAELGDTRDPSALIAGDVVALYRAASAWRRREQNADEVGATLRAMQAVADWTGEAAYAYGTRVGEVASGWSAMATAFRHGGSALEDVAAAIDAARARAGDAVDLWDRADALDAAAFEEPPATPTGWLGPDRRAFLGSGPRAEARAVLADARAALRDAAQKAAAGLRAAIAVPGLGADEWAALLTGCANPGQVLDALAGADAGSVAALLRARPNLAGILAQAEPAAVAPWWSHLDAAQKDALIHAAPSIIGNLGGVAYAARDEANRIWLEDQLADARAALAEAEKPPTYDEIVGGQAAAEAYAERLDRARSRVEGLENIESSLTPPAGGAPRHLITLTGDSPPLAAISIGDLDTADNITYAVPGMGTTTEGMGNWTRASQNLADLQDQMDPGRTHAVVAWVGYQTPPVPIIEGGFDVMGTAFAERGADNLARDLSALEVLHPGAQVNVVAHSYGTTTSSIALTRDDVHVDSYVTLGSAGLPPEIDSATDLHAEAVFSGQAQDVWAVDPAGGDQWAWTGRLSPLHPVDPVSPGFGSHDFSVAGGAGLEPVTDHGVLTSSGNGYLDTRTESLRNVVLATTGQGDGVSPYVAPGPTPFQKALIEGLTHGRGL
ncbi:uncharacterized protein YukE [Microbacterium sp. 1154]|uniref:alpha/beta fold hydrolase n=1 Tax=Microbacterium sp. 1154 TaxID=2817733 RepID=UPI00285A7664|nr:alpha/beta fold hydrolase [Microbacterium sp. 1154]MDR6691284.1 uncharacterized protein YukE [Microbacterium sp. 1154]